MIEEIPGGMTDGFAARKKSFRSNQPDRRPEQEQRLCQGMTPEALEPGPCIG